MPCILCSDGRTPVTQLVRVSNQNSKHPGSNHGWISMSFFCHVTTLVAIVVYSLYRTARTSIDRQLENQFGNDVISCNLFFVLWSDYLEMARVHFLCEGDKNSYSMASLTVHSLLPWALDLGNIKLLTSRIYYSAYSSQFAVTQNHA